MRPAGRTVSSDVSFSERNALLARTLSQPAHREPTGASASLGESFKPESTRASGALRSTVRCFFRETLSGCLSEVGRATPRGARTEAGARCFRE